MAEKRPRIGIVGAGHAGVEAARTAASQGAAVVLFSEEAVLPYFRPRLVALAFGQVGEAEMSFHPADWYAANGIELRLATPVRAIDPAARTLTAGGAPEAFDAIILATGAGPLMPACAHAAPDRLFPLWTFQDALRIRGRVRAGDPLVVVGGGVIGLEAALRATDAGMKVAVIEKFDRLMPGYFSPGGSKVLADLLTAKGIRLITSCGVGCTEAGDGTEAILELDNGDDLEISTGIVCVGASRNLDLARSAGLAVDRGVTVDSGMRTSAAGVFACGDIAQAQGQPVRCAVPEALAQAKIAAGNACAVATGQPPAAYQPKPSVLFFKFKDVEMRSSGAPITGSDVEEPLEGSGPGVHRVRILRNGAPVGVQMIGNCKDFDKHLKTLTG